MTSVGQKVKNYREARGWTQEKLGRIADVSLKTIQRCELGNPVSLETLMGIASAFDIDVSDLSKKTNEERELDKKENQGVFLTRLSSGHELLKILADVHGSNFDHDPIIDKELKEKVRTFIITANDIIDIYGMVELTDQMKMEDILDEQIEELKKNGLVIFGAKHKSKMKDSQEKFDWNICLIRIVKSDNPEIINFNSVYQND
jgi:transcriptional regulator with XRE-family HTH domain